MKKLFSLLLVFAMILSLGACGKKSKEEMIAQAENVTATEIDIASFENLAKAKQAYCNKIITVKGAIKSIEENYVVLGTGGIYCIDVYLSTDEIVMLEVGQYISVVGETTDEIVETTSNLGEYTFDNFHYQMPKAYLVQDKFEETGILKGINKSFSPAYNIEIGDSNVLRLISFSDNVDINSLEYGQKIKFIAKCVDKNGIHYYDAEVIE